MNEGLTKKNNVLNLTTYQFRKEEPYRKRDDVMFWIASTAIIVPLVCLVFLRMNALKGMSISLLSVLGAAYYWKMSITVIGASMIQGVFKAFAIIFILFGATVLLQTLEKTGAIRWVEKSFTAISTDLNILLILIAFLFGSLIEGVAGFGTPAIIAAPILIAVGFSPFAAVVLTLMANKAAVPFGAVGVPTFIGFSNIKQANWGAFQEISQVLSILDFLNIAITPLLLIIFYHVLFTKQYAMIKRYVVFSLMIGISYAIFGYVYIHYVGFEFVSILAPITVFIFAIVFIKKGIFVPKEAVPTTTLSYGMVCRSWSTYAIVVVLLLLTRTVAPVQQFLQEKKYVWENILGQANIHAEVDFFYSPSLVLIIAALLGIVVMGQSVRHFKTSVSTAFKKVSRPSLVLIITLMFVQLFSNSSMNMIGQLSMPEQIAYTLMDHFGSVWLIMAPLLGLLGTFITGSATVSTLTFAPIQEVAAEQLQLPKDLIFATQMGGASAGTMLSINNIISATAMLGMIGKEGRVLTKNILMASAYVVLTIVMNYVLLSFMP